MSPVNFSGSAATKSVRIKWARSSRGRRGLANSPKAHCVKHLLISSTMTYPISEIEGISAFFASKLKSVGIRTTDALLEAAHSVKGRKTLAAKTGISEQQLLESANKTDLGPSHAGDPH